MLVGAALIVGCSEQNAPTESRDALTNPTFNFSNGPDFAGIVERGEFPNAVTWPDFKNGMRVTIGLDMLEFCADIIDFELWDFNDQVLKDRRKGLTHGDDLQTDVWPFTAFDCGLFTTVTPLASGVSDVVNTDNDLFQSGVNDANAWGWRAHGKLTRPSGETAVFNGHINIVVNSSNVSINRKINLK
jgi:hypothetical protein